MTITTEFEKNRQKTINKAKDIKEDTEEIITQGEEQLHKGYDHIKSRAEGLYHSVQESMSDALKEGKEKLCNTQASFEETLSTVAKKVKNKPLSAVLIAASVGFILSAFLNK